MSNTLVCAIQLSSTNHLETNLTAIDTWITKSASLGAKLIVLPENAFFMGKNEFDKLTIAEEPFTGPIQSFIANLAKKNKVWIVGGTLPIKSDNTKCFAASIVWNDLGEQCARYDKIHLFDVIVEDKKEIKEIYEESKTIQPGQTIVHTASPFGEIGLTVCYDLRFPELYRALFKENVEILTVPSAFTETTGKAHFEILLRARAIENFCYVIAPNQTGTHPSGRQTYGHSMIIDPWGNILSMLESGEGMITAEIDHAYQKDIRRRFPVDRHRRID